VKVTVEQQRRATEARIGELEAKLAMLREAHERYWRTDGTGIEREVYDAVIAAVVMEDP
jgi:ribosome-interacting GTPase 1